MIAETVLTFALLIHGTYSMDILYFETQDLCEKAQIIINKTKGNGMYADTECIRIRGDK